MIICHIWDADYPWDVRVEKICDSLAKKHEVHLVCRNSKRSPRYEYAKSFHIHRLPFVSERFGSLNHLIGFPAFFNPFWIYSIWRTIKRTKAEVILVRDLPLAWTAVGIGRLLGLPVVLDMAENYPAMIKDLWDRQGFSFVNFLVRNPAVIGLIERTTVRWCDHILAVVEESRYRLIALGVDPARISLVINTPTSARWTEPPRDGGVRVSRGPQSLVLVYLGLLEWARGIETAIRAIQLVRERLPGVKLVIVGSGRHEGDFKRLVDQLKLQDSVQFLGWLDYSKAIEVIRESDVGLVPHHATESWNTTIPNKLFDYMSMGKPVLVSNAKPTERIVREERCGIVFKERDAEDLARAILALEHKAAREEMGRCGRESVAKRYNWAVDEERLLRGLDIAAESRKR
jgi:glycosyltransferase involved in cell wall biosynthesis